MKDSKENIVHKMASQLLDAVETGEKVDPELIDYAQNVIEAHQMYVQLLYVGMVVDQITQLTHYFDTLDSTVEILDTEDLAETDPSVKVRAVAALNMAIKTKVDVINNMMASRDAIGMLVASLKDTFGERETLLAEGGADSNLLEMITKLPAAQRQRVLGTAVNVIRNSMEAKDAD
jgi:hypothetical protein